ncbi:MAG: hypothetical protein ACI92C_000920 [Neolewinella sp.]
MPAATLFFGITETTNLKSSLLLILISCYVTCVAQEQLYVTPTGVEFATGSSWSQGLNLDAALKIAAPGSQLWLMEGTYVPNSKMGRKSSFILPAGVEVYGGFKGTETSLAERQLSTYSVLSGEIGQPESTADNVYTVVTMKSDGQNITVFDGLHVTAGNSRNFKEGLTTGNAGGGLYIMASGKALSSHMISNCIFEDNTAHNGGGVLVDSGRPSFVNCVFKNNKADFNGGAVYNKGIASLASPIFRDCTFEENSSNSGAGMTNNGFNGEASPLILDCDFINNISLMNGAAIYNIFDDNGKAQTVIEGCSFVGNDSILGDDVSDSGVSKKATASTKSSGGGNLRPTTVRATAL